MNLDWKTIVKNIAPALGTALGGPIGGIATKFIADKFLGNPQASEQEIAQAINAASPEQLVKLKELDLNFQVEMGKQGVDLYALEVQDRSSARNREADLAKSGMRDWTPSILAYLSIVFLVFVTIFFSEDGWKEGEINIWFNVATLVTIAFTYYFGDSHKKNKGE